MEKSDNSLNERRMTPPLSIPQQQRKAKRPSPLYLSSSSPISIPNRRFSESGIEDYDENDDEGNLSRSIGTQTPTEKKSFDFPSTATTIAGVGIFGAGDNSTGQDITDGDMIPKRRSIGGGDGELEVLRNEFSFEKKYFFGGHSPTMSVFSMFAARYDSNFPSTSTATTKEKVPSTLEDDEGIEIGKELRNIGDELDRLIFEQRRFVERRRSTC